MYEVSWYFKNDEGRFTRHYEHPEHWTQLLRLVLSLRADPRVSEVETFRIERVRLDI